MVCLFCSDFILEMMLQENLIGVMYIFVLINSQLCNKRMNNNENVFNLKIIAV